ncbi:MAG: hypothetical protein OXL41_11710 [Nitrospinae bacterium]|nr:hypothetical protein [Nitrospinota bacterium]
MRRSLLMIGIVLIAAVLVLPQAALALEGWKAYDAKAFAQAQKDGKTIFVVVHTDW